MNDWTINVRQAVAAPWAFPLLAAVIGGVTLAAAAWGLRSPVEAQRFARQLPRNQVVGRALMAVGVVWSLMLFHRMDLGAWNSWKMLVYFVSPLIYWFIIRHVNDYLGGRALALILILAAKPVLWVCFLRDEPARLVLTCVAYIWVAAGISIFSAPHWMRDAIAFCQATPRRWAWICKAKMAVGFLILATAAIVH